MYFESKPRMNTFSKTQDAFWECALDCVLYFEKEEGLFNKTDDQKGMVEWEPSNLI
jgi:hypothetical protein